MRNYCALLGFITIIAGCVTMQQGKKLKLDSVVEQRCYAVLRTGMRNDDFWPSIHAAEGLALAGGGRKRTSV